MSEHHILPDQLIAAIRAGDRTQSQVAATIGVSNMVLSNWLRGRPATAYFAGQVRQLYALAGVPVPDGLFVGSEGQREISSTLKIPGRLITLVKQRAADLDISFDEAVRCALTDWCERARL
jgi:hypothetical protein